jgi:hypothetical protein
MSAKKNKFVTIEVTHRELYNNAVEYLYDVVNGQEEIDSGDLIDLLRAFETPEKLQAAFNAGNTVILMGGGMVDIENLNAGGIPFVIVVMRGEDVFCLLTTNDLEMI